MRRMKAWLALLTAAAAMTAGAHHSPSMFDAEREMTLTGEVREFQWSNPHSYIQLLVNAEDGSSAEWSIEMAANAYLYNLGWRPTTVRAGDELIVTIFPLRNGETGGLLLNVTTPDGTVVGGRP